MPRPYRGPRLWLDKKRGTWTIIDGPKRIRTGFAEADLDKARDRYHEYAGRQWVPTPQMSDPAKGKECGVYVIGFGPYVKIGKTVSLKKRLTGLQTPEPVDVYGWLPGYSSHEALLHAKFGKYRLRGEWFRKEGELATWIESGCKNSPFAMR